MDALNDRCSCMTSSADDGTAIIDVLSALRASCPALNSVFLPDDTWSDFKTWHAEYDTVATHRSMLFLALERGHLGRITGPIHRYLIENSVLRSNVRRQYVKDLRERWMFYADPFERHHKSRMFSGRITELQFAEWLEVRGWRIQGLEALRSGCDVEATTASGGVTGFELKSIGSEDHDFAMILRSLAQRPSAGSVSPYAAINYLLFRVFEAANQLRQFNGHRIAVAIIDDLTWGRFEMQLDNQWIDWANPTFLPGDPEWERFLIEQKDRYPDINAQLVSTLGRIDGTWIIKRAYGYVYSLEHELHTRIA